MDVCAYMPEAHCASLVRCSVHNKERCPDYSIHAKRDSVGLYEFFSGQNSKVKSQLE